MQVVFLVAGKGKRLRPVTHETPKPLLPLAGKSLLEHAFDSLKGLPITEVVLVVGYYREQFEHLTCPWPLRVVVQEEQRGTAHAVSIAVPFLTGPTLIILGDILFGFPIVPAIQSAVDGVVWTRTVDDPSQYGVIVSADGIVTNFVEKPRDRISNQASSGIYFIRDQHKLARAIHHVINHGKPHDGEYWLPDALQSMVDDGAHIAAVSSSGWWQHCGTPEEYLQANAALLDRLQPITVREGTVVIAPSWIDSSAVVTDSVIGPHVSIGPGATVVRSVLSDSIVLSGGAVENAVLSHTIIGEDASLTARPRTVNLGSHSSVRL